jgi:hypothetical protein
MKGSDYEAIGWTLCGISVLGMIAFISIDEAMAGQCCCFGIIGLFLANHGYGKKKKEQRLRLQTVYVQPNPIVVQQPIYIPTPAPVPVPIPAPALPAPPIPNPPRTVPEQHWEPAQWGEKARNLELARDWEGAAQAFQKAGLYAEAGRVREAHLEKDKDEDKVVVNIDRIGDNVLHDSVMYNEDDTDGSN